MIGPLAALVLGLAAAAPEAGGGGQAAAPQAPATTVRLGEPFDHTLALRHPREERVEVAPLPPLGPFAALESGCRTTPGDRDALTVCVLKLQLLDLGEHQVPALALTVRGPGGERQVPWPGQAVRAIGATDPKTPGGQLPLRDPPAPPVRVRSWRLVGAVAAGLAALLAALLLRRWWRRRPAGPSAPLLLPPHQRFEKRIGEIVHLDLPRRGRGREHLDRLCDAAREYLAAVAPAAALDLTSFELEAALAARPLPGLDLDALRRFLAAADLVKFARHEPTPAACEAATAFARELLARTRPPPALVTAMTPARPEGA